LRNRSLSWLLGIGPTSASRTLVRATVEEGIVPNIDLPKDAYF